jgi:LysR family transcriptional regulator (chromosome initiation inhibitor)
MPALARFARAHPGVQLDLLLDDQDHTGEWLRRGEVLAAVTSAAAPVQGCNSRVLGTMRYSATASAAFLKRHFGGGVNVESLARAPCLVFNRKGCLQARWLRSVTRRPIEPPCHWLPSTHAFIYATLAGLGWGMNPLLLAQPHLDARRLVELLPGRSIEVALHSRASRLALPALSAPTDAVLAAAQDELRPTRRQGRR